MMEERLEREVEYPEDQIRDGKGCITVINDLRRRHTMSYYNQRAELLICNVKHSMGKIQTSLLQDKTNMHIYI